MRQVISEWVTAHIDETCHTHCWKRLSREQQSFRDMTDSYVPMTHLYKWVMARMISFTMKKSCRLCDITNSFVTWLIHTWHDSFICAMTHLYIFHLPWMSHVTCVIWLIYVWRDWFIRDMTDSYVPWLIYTWHISFIMRFVMYEWVMSRANESRHVRMSHVTCEWVMSRANESLLIWMSLVPYLLLPYLWEIGRASCRERV